MAREYDPVGALGGLFAPAYIYGDPIAMAAAEAWNTRNYRPPPAPDPWRVAPANPKLDAMKGIDPVGAQRDAIAQALLSGSSYVGDLGGGDAAGTPGGYPLDPNLDPNPHTSVPIDTPPPPDEQTAPQQSQPATPQTGQPERSATRGLDVNDPYSTEQQNDPDIESIDPVSGAVISAPHVNVDTGPPPAVQAVPAPETPAAPAPPGPPGVVGFGPTSGMIGVGPIGLSPTATMSSPMVNALADPNAVVSSQTTPAPSLTSLGIVGTQPPSLGPTQSIGRGLGNPFSMGLQPGINSPPSSMTMGRSGGSDPESDPYGGQGVDTTPSALDIALGYGGFGAVDAPSGFGGQGMGYGGGELGGFQGGGFGGAEAQAGVDAALGGMATGTGSLGGGIGGFGTDTVGDNGMGYGGGLMGGYQGGGFDTTAPDVSTSDIGAIGGLGGGTTGGPSDAEAAAAAIGDALAGGDAGDVGGAW